MTGSECGPRPERASGGFRDRLAQPRRAPLRNDYPVGPSGVGGADDRAEVVRVLDAVENDHQSRALKRLEQALEIGGTRPDRHRHDALMVAARGETVERIAWFIVQGDATPAAFVGDRIEPWVLGSARDHHAVQRLSGPQRLGHGVDADQ